MKDTPTDEAEALGIDQEAPESEAPQSEKQSEKVEEVQHEAEEKEKSLEEMTEEELLDKVLEYRALSQRLAADYQNLKKEADDRVANARKYGSEALLLEVAPLMDYFNSAFTAVPEDQEDSAWMKGIQYIQQHLVKVLTDNGVEIIEPNGQEFDEALHEAVSEEDNQDLKPNTVLRVSQVGFKLNGRVVKHAKVVVSK